MMIIVYILGGNTLVLKYCVNIYNTNQIKIFVDCIMNVKSLFKNFESFSNKF